MKGITNAKAKFSSTENIIDIGSGQVTIDSIVYPTIAKTDADEIYLKYASGQPITLLWGTTGIATHISVIYASDIDGYELHCLVHGKVAVFKWTDSTTSNIAPTIISEVTIEKDTASTAIVQELEKNTSYRFTQELSTLELDFPTMTDDYESEVIFKSGATATSLSTEAGVTIKWSGDEVANNTFTPATNKTYNVMFWYDSINLNAVVRGV